MIAPAALLALSLTAADAGTAAAQPNAAPPAAAVRVGHLVYASGETSRCFSSGYLDLIARETDIPVDREPVAVELTSPDLFDFPFVIMSGEGAFALSPEEAAALREYLLAGGFVLASAGCSSAPWAESFTAQIESILPEAPLVELPVDHAVFQTMYDVRHFQSKTVGIRPRIHAAFLNDRPVLVFSPEGLNDTGNAGGGCCCCGGNEIRNAKYINANILLYVLQG